MTRTLRRVWNRLLGTMFGQRRDADLGDEIESHLQHISDDYIRQGIAPEEAHRRARLEFGSVESAKENYRDQRGLPFLDVTLQDARYALRGIRRNPGFAAIALLSLATGIGANTAIFSIVNSVLLQPLAFKEPKRVFAVRTVAAIAGQKSIPVNPMQARAWASECPSLEHVALMGSGRTQIATGGDPASIFTAFVPHNLFALFGVEPILGRSFLPHEEQDGSQRVAILSETLWRTRFNADPSVIGRSVAFDGREHQIIGVVPGWFRLPYSGGLEANAPNIRFDLYRPLVIGRGEVGRLTGNYNYGAVARLKDGVTPEKALAEINVVQDRIRQQAGAKQELKATLIPVHDLVTGRARLSLWMLTAAVGAVLLIMCVNLANLLLSRIASRRREAAIRTALGASRGRQFRLVLTESMLLSISGGALGVLFAWWLLRFLVGITTVDIPRLEEVRLDSVALAFSFCVTVLTGLLFGSLPAWQLTRSEPQEALRAGSHTVTEGRRGLRLRETLIGVEVGLSAALLLVAGLLLSSFTRLLSVEKGFDVQHVLTAGVSLSNSVYSQAETRQKFFDRVLAKLAAIPGVEAAGFITALPTRGETWLDPIYLPGDTRPGMQRPIVNNRYASPGYFKAMNIGIREGRAFDESDRDRHVAVLSEKAARLLWPGESKLVGRTFIGEDDKPKVLIGIASDVRARLQSDPPPTAYYPYWQRVPAGGTLTIRTSGSPVAAATAVRASLRAEDPQLPAPAISTMQEVVEVAVAQRRFQMTLVIVFAASALLVASLGIYGVVSYSVARRRNEIGIRMALGARRAQLLSLIIRQGMTPVIVGLTAGIGVSLLLGQAIRGLLFGVEPTDPVTIAAVAALLLVVGALACVIPARRAAGTDAVSALRFE